MSRTISELRSSIARVGLAPVDTSNDIPSPVRVVLSDDKKENHVAWEALIDNTLIEWGRDPGQLDEEGTTPPSQDTIGRAIRLAERLNASDLTAPTRIVPDVRGGIVFEYQDNNAFVSFHVQPGRDIELRIFKNHRLVGRETILDDE